MIDPKETTSNPEFERKIRSAFQVEDPDQLFIEQLQKKLADQFAQTQQSKRSKGTLWLTRGRLLLSPLAWGAIALILILFMIWGIKNLIPRIEPGRNSRVLPLPTSSQSPAVEPTQSEGSEGVGNLPVPVGMPVRWPGEAITASNVNRVTQLSRLGRGSITGIAWSPNDKTLAVSSSTGIYLYETTNFEQVNTIGNGANVSGVIYSPDGTKIAAIEGTNIKIWEIDSGKELYTLAGTTVPVSSLTFSPDGMLLASGYDYSIIKLWDATSGNEVATLKGLNENEMISQLAFSTDGKMLISLVHPITVFSGGRGTSAPAAIRIWDIASRAELRTLPDCKGYKMALSPDNHTVVMNQDYATQVCDIESGAVIDKLPVKLDYSMAFSPDGTILAGTVNNAIKLWKIASMEEVLTLAGQDEGVNNLAFSPDGSRLASASVGSVKIWDATSGNELNTLAGQIENNNGETAVQLDGYGSYVTDLAFSPDRNILATVTEAGPLKLYDTKTGTLLAELETQVGFNNRVTFSPDGKLIAVSGGRYEPFVSGVQIWDVATQELRLKLDGFSEAVQSVAFSPDGVTLATGEGIGWGFQGAAKLWNIATGEMLQEFGRKSGETPLTFWTVFDVAFSPDGSRLAAANGDGSVLVWNVSKQAQEVVLTGTASVVLEISFSPDGSLLAAAGKAGSQYETNDLRLWDLATGTTLFILEGQEPTSGVVFSPDGGLLASASWEGRVSFWDVNTGKALATLTGSGSPGLAFSPDGTLLATGGDTLRMWGIPPSGTTQPSISNQPIGGAVTPTPQLSEEPQPADSGIEKTLLPILARGESYQPGTWSQDGSYFIYGEQGPVNEPGPGQAIMSLRFLAAQTGETCDSLQETVKMVESWGVQIPEGASLYERTAWMADNRLLYISLQGELFAITPCNNTIENWSTALPESIRSFAWVVDGEGSVFLIKSQQAYWLFSPATQQSVKLALPLPPEGEETYFAWSKWDTKLVASRLERRESELWIILEQIDLMSGSSRLVYETQASPTLETRGPIAAFVEWAGKGLLVLSDTLSGDQLVDLRSQPIISTNLYPDLFGFDFSEYEASIYGVEPGVNGGQDYHLFYGTGLSPDGKFYLYHAESGLVDTLPFDQYLLLVFPNEKTLIAQPWAEVPPADIFRVFFVDNGKETTELVVEGHARPEGSWLSVSALPDATQVLFSSIQGVSLVDLESGKILNFWAIEDQEKYQDFSTYLSPDGKTVVGFARQTDPSISDWTQAMYWLRLEP